MSIFDWNSISETTIKAKRCRECRERIEQGDLQFLFYENGYLNRYHIKCGRKIIKRKAYYLKGLINKYYNKMIATEKAAMKIRKEEKRKAEQPVSLV